MKTLPPKRVNVGHEYLVDFMDVYAVVCPRCNKRARVAIVDPSAPIYFAARRLTCVHCAYTADWRGSSLSPTFSEDPKDWYFKASFYYRTACCGHEFWVLNRSHLEFLKNLVGAKIRSRSRSEKGWSNRSLASRLPKWILSARNREAILAALAGLEELVVKNETVPANV